MRQIPTSLLSKIKSSMQTPHNNANPQLDIIVQQSNQFLSEGLALNPYTIRTGETLGPLDIAVRREIANEPPQELVMVYIEGGIAKLATLDITDHVGKGWKYLCDIGPAVDCAIDFDGRWHRITTFDDLYFFTTSRWALTTFGEPYIALVKSDGTLTVQLGTGEPVTLATGVSAVSMLRGWKNTALWNHDQGLIVAYLKSGVVNYRNYAQQPPDQPALWENEQVMTAFDTSIYPANHISMFRGNDYTTGFLTEINGEMWMTLTPRNWANMAIEEHHISIVGTELLVQLLPITMHDYTDEHHISVAGTELSCKLCPEIYPTVDTISNPSSTDTVTILIECDLDLYGDLTGLQTAFTVVDAVAAPYAVSATAKGITDNIIALTVANFESASGDLTVTYTHLTAPIYAQVEGGCFMQLDNFAIAFTPDLTPPEGYSDHTISVTGTSLTVSLLNVTYTTIHHEHTISIEGTGLTVVLTHIDDLNP